MSRFIIKLTDEKTSKDYYLEWGTIVDAPVTYGLSLQEFKKYYKDEYGREGMKELDGALNRAEATGSSSYNTKLDDILNHNRAGKNETLATKEEILENYCRNRKS